MSIALKKRPPAGVPTPSVQHVTFFVDDDGNPSLKDSNGVVTPATNAGGPIQLNEQPGAPATVAGAAKLYSKIVDGITETFALNDLGDEVQLTADGGIATGRRIKWANAIPGELFDSTQVATTIATPVKAVISNPAFALTGLYTINYAGSPYPTGSVVLVDGDRVLRACTTNPINNGIWIAHAGAWTRAADADSWVEIQDAIVEWPLSTLGAPSGFVWRWTLWNPTNAVVTPGTNPQEWVIVLAATASTFNDDVRVVSTSNITLAGAQTIDGYSAVGGDRVLVNGQTNPVDNGIYTVVDPGAWTRALDASFGMQVISCIILSENGTYVNRAFTLRSGTTAGIVIGVDPQYWELVNTAGTEDFGPVRINADYGDVVMIRSGFPGPGSCYPLINLPPITPQSASKNLSVRDMGATLKGSIGVGLVLLQPSGSDSVAGNVAGQFLGVLMEGSPNFEIESDGLSQWNLAGGLTILMPGGLLIGAPFILGMAQNNLILVDTP